MRVPVSWLRELLPALEAPADEIAAALVRAGLEVEQVVRSGEDVSGVVVAEVLDIEELTGFKKPIRFCHVDVASRQHEVVCGAVNFAVGDRVAFALPGGRLPGGFEIATRQTYGHTSDGVICSSRELGLGDDHTGILVLPPNSPLGADVVDLLQLRDQVLDIAVTPDRGYALSLRGVAREVATAYSLDFHDPADLETAGTTPGHDVVVDDVDACRRYVARTVTGLDARAAAPGWMQQRLAMCGMRSISLAVDVTNYVLLLLGQPLHAFDRASLLGPIRVRRAGAGESLVTLDGQERRLHPEDLVIADEGGAIALAGVMGGERTEVGETTTELVIESAWFDPVSVARTARRHRLPSEASKRFERGADPEVAAAAAELAVRLLGEYGGATAAGATDVQAPQAARRVALATSLPSRLAGRDYDVDTVRRRLRDVGCTVSDSDRDGVLLVTPPSWRPDLTGAHELVEEVVRLEGYDTIPVLLPTAPAGTGLTAAQRLRRTASRSLAAAGLVQVVLPPFVSQSVLDALGGEMTPPRLLNPLAETEGLLRPSLLPGLLGAVARNVARGLADVALFEIGGVFVTSGAASPTLPVTGPPSSEQIATLDAALPVQPRHAALALCGVRGDRRADWADAVHACLAMARALGTPLRVRNVEWSPWHPGRCAELLLDEQRVGFAGELHPRVVEALGLPARTVAAELNLDVLIAAAEAAPATSAPVVSPYPPASFDLALVVDDAVAAADVEAAVRDAAGELLEHLSLFDVYAGPQVGAGRRSLAYSVRLRAAERTLTEGDVSAVRERAVATAAERVGASLRGPAA